MSIGWFDAFRENGAPTWYGENRTPVRLDLGLAILLWLFLIPTLAFLLILPGIRRLRALSSFVFLFSMAIGACLALSIHYPGWHYGQLRIFTAFRAHSRQRISAHLGVNVGLTHVNITLNSEPSPIVEDFSASALEQQPRRRPLAGNSREHSIPAVVESEIAMLLFGTAPANISSSSSSQRTPSPAQLDQIRAATAEDDFWAEEPELYYNERFEFDDVSGMEVREVLEKGLPFPILRVVEYLSVDRTGFLWGKQYRLAGYYTQAALWLAFSLWLLQMCLLCLLPHLFGQVVLLCGLATLFADAVYAWHTPGPADFFLVFPGPDDAPQKLHFHLSTCFYATMGAGVASTAVGSILWLLEAKTSFRLETFFSAYLDRMCRPMDGKGRRVRLWTTHSSRRLPTPKGSFTSLSHPDQSAIGWKRRRRTLRRTAKEWPWMEMMRGRGRGRGGVDEEDNDDGKEGEEEEKKGRKQGKVPMPMPWMRGRGRREVDEEGGKVMPMSMPMPWMGGRREADDDEWKDETESGGNVPMDGRLPSEDCAHHQSQPSSSTTSTRPVDDSGLESAEARSPRTPPPPLDHADAGRCRRAFWSPSSTEAAQWFRPGNRRHNGSGGGEEEEHPMEDVVEEDAKV